MSEFDADFVTSTSRSLPSVIDWLNSMSHWECSGRDGLSHFGVAGCGSKISCRLFDYRVWKTGSADSTVESMGTPKTIQFNFQIGRQDFMGCLDEIYRVAIGFCLWDPSCNVRLSLDDNNRGVFLRRNGRYLVNPYEFFAKSLESLLVFPYEIPDPPYSELEKADWEPGTQD